MFPVSNPGSPGVPFRTFHDPSAKRSAARGILVNPVEGELDRRGSSGMSAAGLPSYTSSLLPIRFTNVRTGERGGGMRGASWLERLGGRGSEGEV